MCGYLPHIKKQHFQHDVDYYYLEPSSLTSRNQHIHYSPSVHITLLERSPARTVLACRALAERVPPETDGVCKSAWIDG